MPVNESPKIIPTDIEEDIEYSEGRDCRVFKGTNVPVLYLWNEIMDEGSVKVFFESFPEVDKRRVFNVLRYCARLTDGFP